jgi:DNA-binding NtrC family response regulator
MIAETLGRTNWHRGETASRLKIPRRTLQRKIQKYALRPPE